MKALHSAYHLWRLRRRLFWSPDRLETLRRCKLRRLLDYCYHHIPYYREQFRRLGAEPGDFKKPEDLETFPILEKETLRDRADEFVDPKADRNGWIEYRSSGSTGIPLALWYLPDERLRMGFTVTREFLHNGLKPWYRMVNITEPRHSAPKNRWYHRLGIMDERFLSVYDGAELNLEKLLEIRPHLLIGFPSVLMLIGDRLRRRGAGWNLKLLFTLAEVLTPTDREVLKELWGIEPVDLYGANEVGHIAFQCGRRGGYHINVDSLHVELIRSGKPVLPGERGEVVVTNFDLRVMPIIRYRVGDVAQFSDGFCSCGCRFPMLQGIAGRSDGFIVGAGGEPFSALEVSLLLKGISGVGKYRLIQETPEEVTVEIVRIAPTAHPEEEIKRILRQRLGSEMKVTVREVPEIAPEKSGKIRSVVSRLPHPFWRPSDDSGKRKAD